MIAIIQRAVGALALTLAASGAASAAGPLGVWIDHTGRGAVEITDCGGRLCGKIVWLKEAKHSEGCNFQVIGDVKPVGGNKWDNGWIIDPDKDPNKKYDVELTPVGDQKLKVVGYIGTKFLSETMMWTRAPASLQRCKGSADAAPTPAPTPGREPDSRRTEREPEPRRIDQLPEPRRIDQLPEQRRDAELRTPDSPGAKQAEPEREAQRPEPRDTAGNAGKDCKVEFAGITISFPCKDLQ